MPYLAQVRALSPAEEAAAAHLRSHTGGLGVKADLAPDTVALAAGVPQAMAKNGKTKNPEGGPLVEFSGTPFVKGSEDTDAVAPNDVKQGALGDCYLLAALAAVAHKQPEVIKGMLKDNQDGTYRVRFYEDGPLSFITGRSAKYVTVRNSFPATNNRPTYAKRGDHSAKEGWELWVMIIEKAWAKLKGSYSDAERGQPG